jgi:hypothetical protein
MKLSREKVHREPREAWKSQHTSIHLMEQFAKDLARMQRGVGRDLAP